MSGKSILSRTKRRAAAFWADESGAHLVEYALVVTLFLFLLFSIIDFGRLAHAWVSANKATQLAARIAAVRPPACSGVPTLTTRPTTGTIATVPFGSLCRAAAGVCSQPATVTCTGVATNATAQEIFAAVRPLMPPTTTIGNMRYTYSPDPNLGFLGGPYVPMVTVEFEGVTFRFVTFLGRFIEAMTGTTSTLGQPTGLQMPRMGASLPAEDLALGMDG